MGHPIITSLQKSFEIAPDSQETRSTALLLYDIAALTGGYSIDDPNAFAKRVAQMLEDRIVDAGGNSEKDGGSDENAGDSAEADISDAEDSAEGGVSDAEVVG